MKPELKVLLDDALGKLRAVADNFNARNAVPMRDNFPMIGSFAHDDPEGHVMAEHNIIPRLNALLHDESGYAAQVWLDSPHPSLGDYSPSYIIFEEGIGAVEDLITMWEQGQTT